MQDDDQMTTAMQLQKLPLEKGHPVNNWVRHFGEVHNAKLSMRKIKNNRTRKDLDETHNNQFEDVLRSSC